MLQVEEVAGSVANCEVNINISKKKFIELTNDKEFEEFSWPYLGLKKVEILSTKIENGFRYEEARQTPSSTPSVLQWYIGKEDIDYIVKDKVDLSDDSSSYTIIPPMMESYINVYGSFRVDEIDSGACKLKLKTIIHLNFWGGGVIEGIIVGQLTKALEVWPVMLEDWKKKKGLTKL